MEKGSSYKSILKYTSLFGGVEGLKIVVGLVRNKLVAVLLGPNGFGFISLLNSTIKVLSDSTSLGLPISAVRHISDYFEQGEEEKTRHYIKVVRSWCLLTALLGAFLCVALAPLLNQWTFTWGDHTRHFMLLAPVVFFTAITGGELAVLKGSRHLKALAQISVINVLAALVISIPLFYFFGQKGIIPSMNLVALCACGVTAGYSYRYYPLRRGREKFFAEGLEMVKVGVFFTLAGIAGSCAEMVIRTYLNNVGDLDLVGYYNAGFMICVTYAGMVFAAMETDYFPRISAAWHDIAKMNETINHQIEVSLLMVGPLLVSMVILLPVLIPLLFTGEFQTVIPMAQVAILAMYFHAVDLPVEYLPLAKGDSLTYLIVETLYSIFFAFMIILGYQYWGLWGTGVALTFAHLVNCIAVVLYYSWRYKVRLSRKAVLIFTAQLLLGVMAYSFTYLLSGVGYWTTGIVLIIVNTIFSYLLFKKYS